MKNTAALSTLQSILADEREDPMVRHEVSSRSSIIACRLCAASCFIYTQAAEAMGAISSSSSLPVLKRYLNDSNRSVRETCEIALAKIEWDHSEEARRHHESTSDEPQSVSRRGVPLLHAPSLNVLTQDLHLGRPSPSDFRPSCRQGKVGERHGVQCGRPPFDPSRHASPALRTV